MNVKQRVHSVRKKMKPLVGDNVSIDIIDEEEKKET